MRYTEGQMGLIFAAQEDHRKPNIIRGGSKNFSKAPLRPTPTRRSNTFRTTVFRQGISPCGLDQNGVTFPHPPENRNGHFGHFDSLVPSTSISEELEEDDRPVDDHQIYITDEFHQLIQPSEISPLQNPDQLMHASIQTDSGNYIMVIRDNEIVSMHSQPPDDDGGGGEDQEVESCIVEENDEECYEEDMQGATECEEVESSNLQCDDVDDEIITAVQSIDHDSDLFLDTEEEENSIQNDSHPEVLDFVEASNSPGTNNSEQYVMVQLSDGNSYLIPASSLQGSSVAVDGSTCGEQIIVNENGDHQVVQVLNTNAGLELQQQYTPSSVPIASQHTTNHSRARKRPHTNCESASSLIRTVPHKKRTSSTPNGHSGNNNLRYLPTSTANSRTIQGQVYHTTTSRNSQQYPQQKPLPQSRSRSSTLTFASNRSRPVEKPRPFRFDMPEEEIVTVDPTTDYLSLVIEQFQKESYLK